MCVILHTSVHRVFLSGVAVLALLLPTLGWGQLVQVTSFGSNPGGLRMYKYVPADMPANAPLVLPMHGCLQQAADYTRSGWNELADEWKFYVLYPEQTAENNSMKCFNWAGEYGDPTNMRRGEGENLSIIQMIDKMKADYSIDASRVYISGLSGGGAQTALMLALWPDVFAGGAIIAGVPYYCTDQFNEVSQCVVSGHDYTPQKWGELVRNAFPDYSGVYPRVSLWHGTSDTTVGTANQRELMEQWTNVHNIDQTVDSSDTVDGYPHREYRDGEGNTLVELYEITGAGHGTPVDPQNGCGSADNYHLAVDICSCRHIGEFFGLNQTQPQDAGWPDNAVTADGARVDSEQADATTATDAGQSTAFVERFSSDGPDEPGWNLGDWELDDEEHSGGGSQSLRANVSSYMGAVTATASISLGIGENATLSYARKLYLAGASFAAEARFDLVVEVGGTDHVLDSVSQSYGTLSDDTWVVDDDIDLSAFAGQQATLKLVATADDSWTVLTNADVRVDDIVLNVPIAVRDAGTGDDAALDDIGMPDAGNNDTSVGHDSATPTDATTGPDHASSRDANAGDRANTDTVGTMDAMHEIDPVIDNRWGCSYAATSELSPPNILGLLGLLLLNVRRSRTRF